MSIKVSAETRCSCTNACAIQQINKAHFIETPTFHLRVHVVICGSELHGKLRIVEDDVCVVRIVSIAVREIHVQF